MYCFMNANKAPLFCFINPRPISLLRPGLGDFPRGGFSGAAPLCGPPFSTLRAPSARRDSARLRRAEYYGWFGRGVFPLPSNSVTFWGTPFGDPRSSWTTIPFYFVGSTLRAPRLQFFSLSSTFVVKSCPSELLPEHRRESMDAVVDQVRPAYL